LAGNWVILIEFWGKWKKFLVCQLHNASLPKINCSNPQEGQKYPELHGDQYISSSSIKRQLLHLFGHTQQSLEGLGYRVRTAGLA
jgi:hypothetical protein